MDRMVTGICDNSFVQKMRMLPHIHEEILKILDEGVVTYLGIDYADCNDTFEKDNYPIEFLYSQTPSGMSPQKLNVKRGAIIMLLRNMKKGHCNGTRSVVTSWLKT